MKRNLKIAGILVIFLMAVSVNIEAQRGMRSDRQDSTMMKNDSAGMHHFGYAGRHFNMMGPGMRGRADGWMRPGMGPYGMRHNWMAQGMMPGAGMMNNAPGRRIMESMPGVTQKQKDELSKINEQQRDAMKKLMEEHQQAVKQLREDHRKKVMNLLTDEQKKWLEEHTQDSGNY